MSRVVMYFSNDTDTMLAGKALRDAGDSYESIAGELGRSKSDVYRVCRTLGCMSAT